MPIHYLTIDQVADIFKMSKKEIAALKVGAVFTLAEQEVICIIKDKNFSRSSLLEK